MNRPSLLLTLLAACLLSPPVVRSASALEVVQSGPQGEVASLEEANEVRVVFSEPMVALGRIPEKVEARFFRMVPATPGALRWSGTRTLIFTPAGKLKYATRYEVTIDASAASVAGTTLAKPHTFSFSTPTVKLVEASWYRRQARFDQPAVILLRFNQPVSAKGLLPHLSFAFSPHEWKAPSLPPDALARLSLIDPRAMADFDAKVARASEAASSSAAVSVRPAADWDKKTWPASDDLLVLETTGVPPTDTWIRVAVDAKAASLQGKETPGQVQEHVLKLEPTFFVEGLRCPAGCDPDGYNPVRFRGRVNAKTARPAVKVSEVSATGDKPLTRSAAPTRTEEDDTGEEIGEDVYDRTSDLTLEDAGFALRPARHYAVAIDRSLAATDGQVLGYSWVGLLENWHQNAFTSFGAGHGVWEKSGGAQLPFSARNLTAVKEWLSPLALDGLLPVIKSLREKTFALSPPGPGASRTLTPTADTIEAFGLNLKPILGASGSGIGWAALEEGRTLPRTHRAEEKKVRATLVQVTDLGISVKDSPSNTLVLVTRLSDGQPVADAKVTIRTLDNAVAWSGTTGPDGLAMAPETTGLRDPEKEWEFRFIVTAEKDGDQAYVGSDWGEGIEPWAFGIGLDLGEARPMLRGTVFSDRGVYKLGEEVHLKVILRSDTAKGMVPFPSGTLAEVVLKDSQGEERDKRSVPLSDWSSADWTWTLPEQAPLGSYEVAVTVAGQNQSVAGAFLVAAYRRPDFRVDVNLAAESSLAGTTLKGVVAGRYLFGAPMSARPVKWTYSKKARFDAPRVVADRFPEERYALVDEERSDRFEHHAETAVAGKAEVLDAQGQLTLDLETDREGGRPFDYTLQGEVTDLSRQVIAGRATFRVDPAPWYLAVRRPGYFVDAAKGFDTEIVAVDLTGKPTAGVTVMVTLTQVQWHAVRRAEGQGYYTWESERRETEAGNWEITTAAGAPASLHVPMGDGGYFVLRATAKDEEGRTATSATGFYALGTGYTSWQRYDHNRIDLVPEKKTYRAGETARLMIQSPWEKATALVTTEREGVRSQRVFALSSTQETVSLPITEDDIPNVYVSVLLVKGRSAQFTPEDSGDPGKPAYRVGYVELKVEDAAKRLKVDLTSDREEYRPAGRATVSVAVQDAKGRPAPSEVTLWAVDYGVLSLTGYQTPDVLGTVWVEKALQVLTADSRQNIISRRVLVSKGADEGGGGGDDSGPGSQVRKDFRVLAFWLGSLPTDAEGRASTTVTLPESLTTYRIMAVAGDRRSRFGFSEREIRTSKPVLLRPAFPRFLTLGDTASFGAVVNSQLKEKGTAIVTLKSLDPALLKVEGEAKKTVEIGPLGSSEVRFSLRAQGAGRARLQMTVKLLDQTDAFEETVPVELVTSPETVAAYGEADPEAKETLTVPAGVVPSFGGLHVETSSTALVGLGEGARYLVDYPYGCAEQRASATLALLLAADLGVALRLSDIEPAKLREAAGAAVKELEGFQCAEGQFAFWKGDCTTTSPYLTSWVLHVLQRAKSFEYEVTEPVLAKGYGALEKALGEARPENEGLWPAYTAWQAFAVKVLAEGGRRQDSHVTRLYGFADRMPVFALSYLFDAMGAAGETGARPEDVKRRLTNAVLPEGGSAHVEELQDPHLVWLWSSNVRSTALVLGSLVRHTSEKALVPGLVRWLLSARKGGRWGNTQENATVLEAIVDYTRKYEAEPPDFRAVITLAGKPLAASEFRSRTNAAVTTDVPMSQLLDKRAVTPPLPVAFKREGTGRLFYLARLRYASSAPSLEALDQGFSVLRSYTPAKAEAGAVPLTTFAAGDLVKVTLKFQLTKERRFVAVTDPLPAGFEPVETWFATTARDVAGSQERAESARGWAWWMRGGFDHVERHDDRVTLFATRLSEGPHEFSYVVRATTSGTFRTAPTHVEEMYEPEVFGRTPAVVVTVTP